MFAAGRQARSGAPKYGVDVNPCKRIEWTPFSSPAEKSYTLYRNLGVGRVPSVLVVPVYVEVNSGFERAVPTLESILRNAGYVFCVGDPLPETLDETKDRLGTDRPIEPCNGQIRTGLSP